MSEKNRTAGHVVLVGAGPAGDLITVRGLDLVKRADVIVYDDLIDASILCGIRPDCEMIYVGKRHGKHSMSQDEINLLLVSEAAKGRFVVRLKGGDPFVFGRGAEEMIFLQEAGVSCEEIPGVSSAIAAPARMGIPVTHRSVAQSFTVVTGHTASEQKENYQALAALHGTIIFLMGIHRLKEIADELIRYGKDPDTPAAVLSRIYSPGEMRIDGTLATIAKLASDAPTPGILLVGETAGMHLMSGKTMPLSGLRVAVAGTVHFIEKTAQTLSRYGALVQTYPVIEPVPLDPVIPEDFSEWDWLTFTSANAIRIFFDALKREQIDFRRLGRFRFACIGRGTADTLAEYGFLADYIPDIYTAQALGQGLAKVCGPEANILILRAASGSIELTEELGKARIRYKDHKIYDTADISRPDAVPMHVDADFIVFGSAKGAKSFLDQYEPADQSKVVCIGEITKKEVEKRRKVDLTAKTHTAEGITKAVIDFLSRL